jgi:hypothetical protein
MLSENRGCFVLSKSDWLISEIFGILTPWDTPGPDRARQGGPEVLRQFPPVYSDRITTRRVYLEDSRALRQDHQEALRQDHQQALHRGSCPGLVIGNLVDL